jgi:hypothetical protein
MWRQQIGERRGLDADALVKALREPAAATS